MFLGPQLVDSMCVTDAYVRGINVHELATVLVKATSFERYEQEYFLLRNRGMLSVI